MHIIRGYLPHIHCIFHITKRNFLRVIVLIPKNLQNSEFLKASNSTKLQYKIGYSKKSCEPLNSSKGTVCFVITWYDRWTASQTALSIGRLRKQLNPSDTAPDESKCQVMTDNFSMVERLRSSTNDFAVAGRIASSVVGF